MPQNCLRLPQKSVEITAFEAKPEIGNKSFKPSCGTDKTGQVYLPISSTKILIGTLESEKIEQEVKTINEAIAKCSYEQFICSEKTNDKIALMQIIGTDAYLASDEEIENELDEIRNNFNLLKYETRRIDE